MNKEVVNILLRIVFGIIYLSFYLTLKESGQTIVSILSLFWGAIAFISPASWKEKFEFNYWAVLLSGVLILPLLIFTDILFS